MTVYTPRTPEQQKAMTAKSIATRKANIAKREAEERDAYERKYLLKTDIEQLEARLRGLRKIEAMDALSSTLTAQTLLREEEIVAAAKPWKTACGVYFLVDGSNVVYVGQSVNVYARIAQHMTLKKFDSYTYIPCGADTLDVMESLYIHFLRPQLNENSGRIYAPLSLNDLFSRVTHKERAEK